MVEPEFESESEKEEFFKYVSKIKELTGTPEDEIIKKVAEIVEKGTIRAEDGRIIGRLLTWGGAARVLFINSGGIEEEERTVTIDEVINALTGILYARVLKVSEPREVTLQDETTHKVVDVVLGDSTCSASVSLWDERTELAKELKRGDIVKLSGCYYAKGRLMFSTMKKVTDENEIAKLNLPPADEIPLYPRRLLVSLLRNPNFTAEVRATITNVYKTAYIYKACPTCGSGLRNGFCRRCNAEQVSVVKKLRVPVQIDDGTARVRCVLWDNIVKKLVNVGDELVVASEINVERVWSVLTKLLKGREVVFVGHSAVTDYGAELKVRDAYFPDIDKELVYIKVTRP